MSSVGYQQECVELEAENIALRKLIPLCEETLAEHRDLDSGFFNHCDIDPCDWCEQVEKIIKEVK